jgi:flagellar protein FlaG
MQWFCQTAKFCGERQEIFDGLTRHPRSCHHGAMTTPPQQVIRLEKSPEYREAYANSVQIRVNLWDFFLMFGTISQSAPDNVSIQNFQGVYISPPQAKALLNVLQQNVSQYESAFGEIRLEPNQANVAGGIVQ